MKRIKKYNSEHDLISEINCAQREANKIKFEAEKLDDNAKAHFMAGDAETGGCLRDKATKLKEKANRIENVKIKKLGNALAEFRTLGFDCVLGSDKSVSI